MKVATVEIKGFRLLHTVDLALDERTTVIVGRNNSGKTSLTELFRRILGEKPAMFQLEDFSLSCHAKFWEAYLLHKSGGEDPAVRAILPSIEVLMTIAYDSNVSDLGPLSEFIIDLDPTTTQTKVRVSYQLKDGAIGALFDGFESEAGSSEEQQQLDLFKHLKVCLSSLYQGTLSAVDPNDDENTRNLDGSRLRKLVEAGFINAQRGLDDITTRDQDILGKILEALFRTAKSSTAQETDRSSAQLLETAVEKMQDSIGSEFSVHLKSLLPALKLFGYPGLSDPSISTETTLSVENLLSNNTRIRYAGVNGVSLPEGYNGLGTRNLIYILFRLLEFFKAFKASQVAPGLQLVFIEEPEAHLHPQMQEVFIKKLADIAKVFSDTYNEGEPWPVQFVVTTHSPHLANQAPFDATRYFIATPHEDHELVCSTTIKDLSKCLSNVPAADKQFLHKYMTLTRCDLLFADKAVLIEGATERLMFPRLVENLAAGGASTSALASQYISVVEVGGAYAHRFFDLLRFLEVPTLVITDIDAVDSTAGGKACKVADGDRTSNACIKEWFDNGSVTPAELITKTASDRTNGIVFLAYQVPEEADGPCGRSFEDAFILANRELFGIMTGDATDYANEAWLLAKGFKDKKTDFALKYGIDNPSWSVPRYISEGLKWLAGPATTVTEGNASAQLELEPPAAGGSG